ncbi:MAG: hypothetical protein WCJ30_14255 [Deltaproteobacteria bacterium]
MDGNHSAASIVYDTTGPSVTALRDDAPSIDEIESEAKVFAFHVEAMLSAVERQGTCQPYQTQVARALLGSLLEALDELRPPRNSRP